MALKWKARWISFGQNPADDLGVFRFRRVFRWTGSGPLEVKVSADQRYKLFVNGKLVGDGPQRGDLQNWHFETYSLTGLTQGENTIEAVVWSFGRYAPMAQHTYRLAFVLDGEGVSTPDGWEVARVVGHDFEMMHNEVGGFYIDVGPGEVVSTTPIALDWKKPNVVGHVLERGEWEGDSPWFLVPRTIPPMKQDPWAGQALVVDRQTNERSAFDSLIVHPGEKVLLDFGHLLAAYPQFKFEGNSGTTVKVTYGEGLFDKDGNKNDRNDVRGKSIKGYQDRFIVNDPAPNPLPRQSGHEPSQPVQGGDSSTLWWRTWRYMQLESDQPVKLASVGAVETGYPYKVESSFTADDPWVENIWDVGLRTAKLCAGETYFDCPYYEQLQYVGDTRIQTLIHYYLSRDRALPRNAVEQFARSILPNGLTQSRYPSRVVQIIPPFSIWWVAMLVDGKLYDQTSKHEEDKFLIDRLRDEFKRLQSEDPRHWLFYDWVSDWPAGVPHAGPGSNLLKLQDLLVLVMMARSENSDKAWHAWVENHLRKFTRDQDGLLTDPISNEKSEHAEALYRLVQKGAGQQPNPWPTEALAKAKAAKCTYYFQFYKHLAMQPDDYMAELEPWKEMIRNGLTTFAEAPEPVRSDCHAWSAHPLLGFFQHIAGVTSTAPGWKFARIAPKPGKLKHFDAKIAHPDGDLTIRWNGIKFTIDSPVGFEFEWKGKKAIVKAGKHEF